jgi:hypothetical protein
MDMDYSLAVLVALTMTVTVPVQALAGPSVPQVVIPVAVEAPT